MENRTTRLVRGLAVAGVALFLVVGAAFGANGLLKPGSPFAPFLTSLSGQNAGTLDHTTDADDEERDDCTTGTSVEATSGTDVDEHGDCATGTDVEEHGDSTTGTKFEDREDGTTETDVEESEDSEGQHRSGQQGEQQDGVEDERDGANQGTNQSDDDEDWSGQGGSQGSDSSEGGD